jgi:hypothetical protein
MLTGIWAFQGKTVIDVRHQVLHGTPKPLAICARTAAAAIQQIINRALMPKSPRPLSKIKTMRDELRGVLQEISGMPILQGDTFAPRHLENNP